MIPATLALFAWPMVALLLFRLQPPLRAIIWTIVLGYLFLPPKTGINLPLLPPIDKDLMPVLSCIMIMAIVMGRHSGPTNAPGKAGSAIQPNYVRPGLLPQSPLILGLIAVLVIGNFMTALTNGNPLFFGPRMMPGLRLYDAFSMNMLSLFGLLPLLLARKFLGHPEAHKQFLYVLVMAGLAYSFLILFEVRLSPQLNRMVYGFHAHNWVQAYRFGGYRPPVFLGHGLLVAIFMAMSLLATAAYLRIAGKRKFAVALAIVWLGLTLVLAKSLGALMIAALLLPVMLLLSARVQIVVAAVAAAIILTYPLLRSADLVPTDRVIGFARSINEERAGSLAFRIANEDILLARARQRPLFGWGGWSRSRVFNEYGQDISVTDGSWVIELGVGGWARYLSVFGMLTIPMIMLATRRGGSPPSLATSALSLVLIANLIDLIPNSSMSPLVPFLAGALIGRAEYRSVREDDDSGSQPEAPEQTGSRYTRMPQTKGRQSSQLPTSKVRA